MHLPPGFLYLFIEPLIVILYFWILFLKKMDQLYSVMLARLQLMAVAVSLTCSFYLRGNNESLNWAEQ